LEVFRRRVNDSISIGLAKQRILAEKALTTLLQPASPSYYKLCAISRAAGILASRKKSLRRGFPTASPYAVRQQLVSCYGFKTKNGGLEIPVSRGKRLIIRLTEHTINVISQPGVEVHSFTLTQNRLCLSIPHYATTLECTSTVRVDRIFVISRLETTRRPVTTTSRRQCA